MFCKDTKLIESTFANVLPWYLL